MLHYRLLVPLVITAWLGSARAAVTRARRAEPDLTFAETVYAKLSGACEYLQPLTNRSLRYVSINLNIDRYKKVVRSRVSLQLNSFFSMLCKNEIYRC